MKNFSLLLGFLSISFVAVAQLPIAYYDFENNTNRTLFENVGDLSVNPGASGFASANGTISNENGAGIFNLGSQSGKAISFYKGSSAVIDPKEAATSYLQFSVNTTGFTGISINFDVLANNSNSSFYGINYSTNGIVWTWIGSVATPGTGNAFPWPNTNGVAAWANGNCIVPAAANNTTNLFVRIYTYKSGNNSPNAHLRFDNVQVSATGTTAGVNKTMLNDSLLYTGKTSGLQANINAGLALKRKKFTVSGLGTNVSIPYLDLSGVVGEGGNLTVADNATLQISSGSNSFFVDSAKGSIPASAINILTGGKLVLNNTLECQGILNINNGRVELNGQNLLIGGSVTRATGIINAASGTIQMVNKKAAQPLSGAFFLGKKIDKLVNSNPYGIQISSAANDTLMITGALSFGNVNNSSINTGDNLTIVSSATATAVVADLTNNGINSGNSITGKATVERYISNAGKWRLLAVPTNSTQSFKQSWQENAATANANPAAGYGVLMGDNRSTWATNGFDIYTPGGPTVKTYNSMGGSFTGISSTQAPIKTTGGYMTYIRSNRSGSLSATTMRSSGALYTGVQPVINVPANQFLVVGNPFAAQINLNNVTMQGLQDAVYVWDPKAGGGYGLGAYQTLLKMGNNYVVFPGGGSYGAQLSVANTIESGQAFFVKALAGGGSIQFEENDKQTGSRMVFRAPRENSPMLRATLFAVTADTSTLLDAAMANFDTAYANSVDEEDLVKFTNGSENVSIKNGTALLMADRRNDVTAQDTIRLNLTGVRIQTYKWNITLENMVANGRTAFLQDAYTNSLTPLNMNGTTAYSFTMVNVAGAYAANRFSIVFAEAVVLPVTITTLSAARSNTKSNNVTINWKVENEINLQSYEVEHSTNGSTFKAFSTMNAAALNSGNMAYTQMHTQALSADNFYRIKANSVGGQVQYSATVKVAAINEKASISVYPNPVEGRAVQLRFVGQQPGRYQVQMVDAVGQVIYQSSVTVSSAVQTQQLSLPTSTAAGAYQLKVLAADGSSRVQQLMLK